MTMAPIWDWIRSVGIKKLAQPRPITAEPEFVIDEAEIEAYRQRTQNPIESRITTSTSRARVFSDPLRQIQSLQVDQFAAYISGADTDKSEDPKPSVCRLVRIVKIISGGDQDRVFGQLYVNKNNGSGVIDLKAKFIEAWRHEAILEQWPDTSLIPTDSCNIPFPPDVDYTRQPYRIGDREQPLDGYRAAFDVRELQPNGIICNEISLTKAGRIGKNHVDRIQDVHKQLLAAWTARSRRAASS